MDMNEYSLKEEIGDDYIPKKRLGPEKIFVCRKGEGGRNGGAIAAFLMLARTNVRRDSAKTVLKKNRWQADQLALCNAQNSLIRSFRAESSSLK